MSFSAQTAQETLEELALKYRGPGGCAAILKDGEVMAQQVWGYASLEERIPMDSNVQMPICSITKQMICMLIHDLAEAAKNRSSKTKLTGDLYEQLTYRLHELLSSGATDGGRLTIDHLCDMHSGLRDYWSLCTLWGSHPESVYSIKKDNKTMLSKLKSLHFQPGDQFSYANTNFNILGRLLEEATQDSLDNLLAEWIFGPAQMTTTKLWADNAIPLPQSRGYEGTPTSGFIPTTNNIEWAGDAGVVATLNDMIAFERFFHHRLTNAQDSYRTAIKPHRYTDDTVSSYRYGLSWVDIAGVTTVGHGGAIRGFRLHRRHAIEARVSVVVLFNHEADAELAVEWTIQRLLGHPQPVSPIIDPNPKWFGHFLDRDTNTVLTVSKSETRGAVCITDELHPLILVNSHTAKSSNMQASVGTDNTNTVLQGFIVSDNRKIVATRLGVSANPSKDTLSEEVSQSLVGTYHCSEIDSTLHVEGTGLNLYGMFGGFMGKGPPHLMTYLGSNVWALADQRAVDAPAPGNWTVVVRRGASNDIEGLDVGCWLARRLVYSPVHKES